MFSPRAHGALGGLGGPLGALGGPGGALGGPGGPWGPGALGGPRAPLFGPIWPLLSAAGQHLQCSLHWSPAARDSNLGWVGVDTSGGGVGTTTRHPPTRHPPPTRRLPTGLAGWLAGRPAGILIFFLVFPKCHKKGPGGPGGPWGPYFPYFPPIFGPPGGALGPPYFPLFALKGCCCC